MCFMIFFVTNEYCFSSWFLCFCFRFAGECGVWFACAVHPAAFTTRDLPVHDAAGHTESRRPHHIRPTGRSRHWQIRRLYGRWVKHSVPQDTSIFKFDVRNWSLFPKQRRLWRFSNNPLPWFSSHIAMTFFFSFGRVAQTSAHYLTSLWENFPHLVPFLFLFISDTVLYPVLFFFFFVLCICPHLSVYLCEFLWLSFIWIIPSAQPDCAALLGTCDFYGTKQD